MGGHRRGRHEAVLGLELVRQGEGTQPPTLPQDPPPVSTMAVLTVEALMVSPLFCIWRVCI